MITAHARLSRGSVFLAGEALECEITFTHVLSDRVEQLKAGSPAKRPRVEHLAWASGQMNCQCTVSESRVHLPLRHSDSATDLHPGKTDTAFVASKGERGMTVLSTTPQILFCDLKLAPGESKTFVYKDTIPKDAPPSFKGQSVKYAYKLTIGTQRLNAATKLLRIPFRVLVLYGLNDLSVYTEPGSDSAPSNPFLVSDKHEHSVLDVALEVLSTVTARTKAMNYNITNARGTVAQVCFFKQAYKMGEDVIATFDFTDHDVPCVQFSVSLQSEEQVSEECRQSAGQPTTLHTYTKHHEFCLHVTRTHMSLPIPLSVTPSFITDIVCLRWKLHFEFTTLKSSLPLHERPRDPSRDELSLAPASLDVETMVWNMPVKIFATNPHHANVSSLSKTQVTMNV